MNGLLGGAGLLVGLFLFLKFVVPRMMARASAKSVLFLFEAKASVLRGARVELLSVESLEEPPEGEEAEGRWVRLRLRVVPKDCSYKWDPSDLALIPARAVRGRQLTVEQVEESEGPHEVGLVEWDRSLQDPEQSSNRTFRSANAGEQIPRKIVGPGVVELVDRVPSGHQKMQLHYCHVLVGNPLQLSDPVLARA